MKDLERVLKALANRRRLAIIKLLKNKGEASVGEIAEGIKLSFKATSKHLKILSSVDLIDKEQRSLTVFYSLMPPLSAVLKVILTRL